MKKGVRGFHPLSLPKLTAKSIAFFVIATNYN
jgi:hypothetical protein